MLCLWITITCYLPQNRKESNYLYQFRITRVFKAMSEFIPSRTAIQCRSHHQKELAKHGTVRKIINNFKNKFGK